MGRRIDLNSKNNNSDFIPNRNSHSFYVPYEENIDESSMNDENEEVTYNEVIDDNSDYNRQNIRQGIYNRVNSIDKMKREEEKKLAVKFILKNPVVRSILLISIPIILLILLIIFMIAALSGEKFGGGLAIGGYYAMRCPEVTVYMADKANNYQIVDTKTYDFEDYIAGVVSAEVGGFNNLEVYKEFAIAARTYFLTHDDNCAIESSDRYQVFRETSDSLIYQAIEETKGKVILTEGELESVQYDAFCSINVDNNYYTIKQGNQKIPRSWVDSQSGIASSWKQGNCEGNHGNGLSQWGSLYLASEEGYTYDKILQFYLGDDITISKGSFASSIPGLEIKDTTDSQELHEALGIFLINHGSSIDELNNAIYSSVEDNGIGTREGVVTAAVSLVNILYDNYHVRIPYYWGGQFQANGASPEFGSSTKPATSGSGTTYYYDGLDCSGFVSWAIRNGGYNFSRHTTQTFDDDFGRDSCNINDSSCVGAPGDLINSASCHVQMIVATDEASNTYFVAESTGSYGVIMRQVDMHSGNCGGSATKIIYMDRFYENSSNVDNSY